MKFWKWLFSLDRLDNRRVIRIVGIKIKIRLNYKMPDYDVEKTFALYNYGIHNIKNNKLCTGCSACANICPVGAISMCENADGFLHPVIDDKKCIHCGLCNNVCPIINWKNDNKPEKQDCYACQADDETRKNSSSGGMFYIFAQKVLLASGYVCGVKWKSDFSGVEHTIIHDIAELPDLCLSKYVQSNPQSVFQEIKALLDDNKFVMFVGTPCQVAGLKSFLRKPYDNLLLIDLVCCSAPSKKVFNKYINEMLSDNEHIKNIQFRMKDCGWYSRAMTVETNLRTIRISNIKSEYLQTFFKGICTNNVCQVCPFDTKYRHGDITLGDFWGIGNFNKKLDDNKGTSFVLINTKRGAKFIKHIDMKLRKKTKYKYALPENANLLCPISHPDRDQFFYNLDKMSVADNYKKCLRRACDCIIFNNAITEVNYGSMLTAYAAQEIMCDLGYYAKILNHARVPMSNYKDSFAEHFAKKYLHLTQPCNTEADFIALNDKTNIFIVGSDQMWRPKYWIDKQDKVLLDFVQNDKKKIALAISFGVDYFEGTPEQKQHYKKSLQTFSAVSVREKSGIDICKQEFNCAATWILDPVFIIDPQKWRDMAQNSSMDCSGAAVYYDWDEPDDKIKNIATQMGCDDIVNITYAGHEVPDWLRAIQTSKLVISNSFHGICFAIIFHKPFICINNIGQGRFDSLNALLKLKNNIVTDLNNIDVDKITDIDYEKIEKILTKERQKSLEFLRNALNKGGK